MTKEIHASAEKKMKHTLELTRKELSTIRTGRASLAIQGRSHELDRD